MANIGDNRPVRVCDLCGGIDDHPRHVIATPNGDELAKPSAEVLMKAARELPDDESGHAALDALMDDATATRHLDCCAAAGCPDGSCNTIMSEANEKRGQALLHHITREK